MFFFSFFLPFSRAAALATDTKAKIEYLPLHYDLAQNQVLGAYVARYEAFLFPVSHFCSTGVFRGSA